ncbi:MAG: AAA family ATPase [Oscillospiraceae bacterium]|nr:AAA family ATPase [Oscillospiraceae bacterium]
MESNNQVYEEAMRSVIGSLLIDPDHAAGPVMQLLAVDDFDGAYRNAFREIRKLWANHEPIDVVVVMAHLGDSYAQWLREILTLTPTAANAEAYARVVKDEAALLRFRDMGVRLTGAPDLETAQRILADAETLLSQKGGLRGRAVSALMADFVQWVSDPTPPVYLPWGLRQLDETLTAEAGDFIVLGADSSVGKTALAVQLAWAQAAKGKRVGFFSLETNAMKLTRRLVAQRARVPMSALKTKDLTQSQVADVVALGVASNKVPLFIYDAAGCSVDELRAAAVADRLDVVFVDYVQLLSAPGRERWEIVTAISMGLHTMAQRLGVTVVGLSQITAESKSNKARSKPGKDDLRESKQLKQDADLILMLSLADPEDTNSLRWLRIEKNKDGPLGSVCLRFDPEHMDFTATDSRAFDNNRYRRRAPTFKDLPDDGQEALPF